MNTIQCKYCQPENIVKYGIYKGVQRYYCYVEGSEDFGKVKTTTS